MKTKILSLAIALMMLVSIVTVMPVGAIVYDNNDVLQMIQTLTCGLKISLSDLCTIPELTD